MTKQEIEALGQSMLKEHGLHDWAIRAVSEEYDTGDPEDDIEGFYGHTCFPEKLIWVNMRYADDPALVREILLHEIAHALLGQRERRSARGGILGQAAGDRRAVWLRHKPPRSVAMQV